MNAMVAKIISTLTRFRHAEPPIDLSENPLSTAAFPGAEEPEQIHQGKRRLKENYTNHWDMDYLPTKEVDKLYEEKSKH
jgi:hypothetical protein